MGAFNWLLFDGECPSCGKGAKIRAQLHNLASYDGDSEGRFHDRSYRIGERMNFSPKALEDSLGMCECCYSDCLRCGADLFAVVKFVNFTPVSVANVGFEKNWPNEYPK